MSFRARLALFFVLIVVIPVTAVAVLVERVSTDSQVGKADAQLSTAITTALEVYERHAADAQVAARDVLADEGVAQATLAGDPGRLEDALAAAARERGLEHLSATTADGTELAPLGEEAPIATAELRTTGAGGGLEVVASTTTPSDYVSEVKALTGLEAAVALGGGRAVGTTEADIPLPASGSAVEAEVDGRSVRAAAGALPESGGTRVVVLAEIPSGGALGSQPAVAGALALFLIVALALIALVFRTLQGQIGAMLQAARRIGEGDFSQRVPVVGRDEMAGLASEFNDMTERLQAQIAQLERQRVELERSVERLGEAFAAGLDRDALLAIVAETALSACDGEYVRVQMSDGVLIERPEGLREGSHREAALAAEGRARADGVKVQATRGDGHALAAPLTRLGREDDAVGTFAIARRGVPFLDSERKVFVYLLRQAAASIENISTHELVSVQAVTDELTGLPNNRAFRETIDREAARAERFGHELSLVILDVDDFKQVNDTYGHLQGDEVLRALGRILKSEPRAIDEPARYGGEEFVVALPETGIDGAVELAERIRTRLAHESLPLIDGGGELTVTASFGAASIPSSAGDVRELFAAADEALYEAKRTGKDRVVTAPVRNQAFSGGNRQ